MISYIYPPFCICNMQTSEWPKMHFHNRTKLKAEHWKLLALMQTSFWVNQGHPLVCSFLFWQTNKILVFLWSGMHSFGIISALDIFMFVCLSSTNMTWLSIESIDLFYCGKSFKHNKVQQCCNSSLQLKVKIHATEYLTFALTFPLLILCFLTTRHLLITLIAVAS